MEQEIEQLKSKINQEVRLTSVEKEQIRDQLVSFMYSHPIRNSVEQSSTPVTSQFFATGMLLRFALAGIVLVGFSSGGMALAEKAVPGDILYAMKTRVNEPVAALFISGDKEEGLYAVRLASRRLEEAEALATRQTLSEDAKTTLERELLAQTFIAHEKISVLQNTDTSAAVAVSASLEVAMRSHGEILAAITQKDSIVSSSPTSDLAETVSSEAITATNLHIDAQTKALSATLAYPATQNELLALQAELRDLEGRFGDKLSVAPLKEYVQKAKALITESSNSIAIKQNDEALHALEEASMLVKEISVLAQAPVPVTTAVVRTDPTVMTSVAPKPPAVGATSAITSTSTSSVTPPTNQ